MGMTRSERTGWPELATSYKKPFFSTFGKQHFVAVAKHGHGFNVDIDDLKATPIRCPHWALPVTSTSGNQSSSSLDLRSADL